MGSQVVFGCERRWVFNTVMFDQSGEQLSYDWSTPDEPWHQLYPVQDNLHTSCLPSLIENQFCFFRFACHYGTDDLLRLVSVGTLLAFTTVAISILILRYVPPEEALFPSSLQDSIHSELESCSSSTNRTEGEKNKDSIGSCEHLLDDNEGSFVRHPLIEKAAQADHNELRRRKIASWELGYSLCMHWGSSPCIFCFSQIPS